jgi:hypothetical protein
MYLIDRVGLTLDDVAETREGRYAATKWSG